MLNWFINRHPTTYLKLFIFFGLLFFATLQFKSIPLGQWELEGQIVGESLAAGQTLYRDVKTNLAPLSAGFLSSAVCVGK